MSSEGVQQGHPLGSIVYDISAHPTYRAVASSHPAVKLIGIHDDLYMIGPATHALAAFTSLHRSLSLYAVIYNFSLLSVRS